MAKKPEKKRLHPEVRKWLHAKQSKGGSAKTEAKKLAAQKNGLKAPQVVAARSNEGRPD